MLGKTNKKESIPASHQWDNKPGHDARGLLYFFLLFSQKHAHERKLTPIRYTNKLLFVNAFSFLKLKQT